MVYHNITLRALVANLYLYIISGSFRANIGGCGATVIFSLLTIERIKAGKMYTCGLWGSL